MIIEQETEEEMARKRVIKSLFGGLYYPDGVAVCEDEREDNEDDN